MSTRFSSVDLAAVVPSLNACVGMRVANIYDLDRKTLLFKMSGPDRKDLVLIESGVRIHLTAFNRERPPVPSVFTVKLRKLLRTKRLESAEQQALDRLLVLTFGSGEALVRLVLEFYAAGNIIVTDAQYNILALTRSYEYAVPGATDGSMAKVSVGQRYPISNVRRPAAVTREQLHELVTAGQQQAAARAAAAGGGGGGKKSKPLTLRDVLTNGLDVGPRLVAHCVAAAGLPAKAPPSAAADADVQTALLEALGEVERQLASFKAGNAALGYIYYRADGETFEMCAPLQLAQFATRKVANFDSFMQACDEFFSKVEAQRVARQRASKLGVVERTLERVRADHVARIRALEKQQRETVYAAELIQRHIAPVEQAIAIVRSAIANKLDWTELKQLVNEERRRGNPIASLIHKLHLEKNHIELVLVDDADDEAHDADAEADRRNDDNDDDDDDDDDNDKETSDNKNDDNDDDDDDDAEDDKERGGTTLREHSAVDRRAILVDIDLALSAHANMRRLYDANRAAVAKMERTKAAAETALKRAETAAQAEMRKVHVAAEVTVARRKQWFEKFHWFVSSDQLIVVAGRDAQQNEMLVRRYLRAGDAFVHADMHGAATCVVRRPGDWPRDRPLPPATLDQAGAWSVCRSAAWTSKVTEGAWWVEADQVSKTAPSGEYLSTGGFMIRGKKNYLQAQPLQMGFGLLFFIDDDSVARRRLARNAAAASEQKPDDQNDNNADDNDDDDDDGGAADGDREADSKPERAANAASSEPALTDDNDDASGSDSDDDSGDDSSEDDDDDDDDDDMFRVDLLTSRGSEAAEPDNDAEELTATGDTLLNAVGSALERKNARLTKRQRRLLKQGKDPHAEPAPAPAPARKKPATSTAASVPRGKRGKAKKQLRKYAEQDDDERRLQELLLGVQRPADTATDAAAPVAAGSGGGDDDNDDAAPEAEPVVAVAAPETKRCFACQELGHTRDACPTREIAALLADEGLAAPDPVVRDNDAAVLASLVGAPDADDVLLFVVACAAPYAATKRWRYKAKLTPGSQKRGAAVKQCVTLFLREHGETPREHALIKALDHNEMTNAMISDIQVWTGATGGKKATKGGGGGGAKRGKARKARGANKRVQRSK